MKYCNVVDAQESCIQVAKRSVMVNYVIKGHRFADTQESCFEAWKRSHMDCSALLYCRFGDSQESRFQALKCSNMGSPLLEVVCSANIHEFYFQPGKRLDMDYVELQEGQFADVMNGIFKL